MKAALDGIVRGIFSKKSLAFPRNNIGKKNCSVAGMIDGVT